MKKNDVVIKVNPQDRKVYFNDNFLGLNAENLQSNLVFEFDGEFVNGSPRVEVEKDGNKYIITDVTRVNDTYVMEIKSSLLTTDTINMQLVITEAGDNEIPIFKSKQFYLFVGESINASTEIPDEYETLYDEIQEKIAEVNNLNITGERVTDGVEITFTDKLGNETTEKVNDGQDGKDGKDGKNGVDGFSPIANVEKVGKTATITITDKIGTTTASISDGEDGEVPQDVLDQVGLNSMVYNTLPKIIGNDDTINNTSNTPMELELLPSELEQVTTTGANRLIPTQQEGYTITKNGVTITIKEKGEVSLNGTASAQVSLELYKINLENNETYYANLFNNLFNSSNVYLQIYDNNYNFLKNMFTTSDTYTLTNDYTNARIYLVVANGITINTTIKPMMTKGSQATSYEPYTGNAPSPSPDYPQEIHTVTGDNEVDIVGKNLFDKDTITNNYYYDTNGNYVSVNETYLSNFIEANANNSYTLQTSQATSTKRVNYFDSNKTWLSQTTANTADYTFTTPNNTKYIRISFNQAVNKDNIMLNKGTTALPYTPYQSQTYPITLGNLEMCKIGDYSDEFILATNETGLTSGKWYLKKNIKKYIFTGNETINSEYSSATRSGFWILFSDILPYTDANEEPDILTTKFTSVSMNATWVDGNMSMTTYEGSTQRVRFFLEANKTTDDLKNILINQPIYYVLQTPEYILLNDTLQTELNNIQKAVSYNEQTNILQVNDDLPFIINYSANKNVPTKLSELENDSGYVKNTDYATNSTGGVLKASAGLLVNASNGNAYCEERSYAQYQSSGGTAFISKGTLENVITGKGLVKNTDYASSSTGGVVKVNSNYGTTMTNGYIIGDERSYAGYSQMSNYGLIGKGTLENVITGKELLSANDVKNNVVSTDEDKPLSANMGKELNDRIQNLASIGKYLAMWDCSTGLPTTDPVTMPYTYTTGDYYVISNVDSTNYMPNGSTYSGTASSTQYSGTETLNVGDFFYYDGTVWTMLKNTGKTVYFANIAGSPMDNSNLASALNGKVGFTDYAGSSTAGVIKIQSWSGFTNSSVDGLYINTKTYADYTNATNTNAINKGTLENVLGARFVTLTQAQYDALVSGGTVDSNTYYFIEEE